MFGVETHTVINSLSVSTAVSKILKNNPDRLSYILVNLGTVDVYVGFTSDVSASKGILLTANGGSMNLTIREDFDLATYEVHAVAASSTSTLYIVEEEIL